MFVKKLHWIHNLSIDAALIAITWQLFIARQLDIQLGFGPPVVLGLSIFLAYLGDRWLDVKKMDPAHIHTARHNLIANHENVWVVVFVIGLIINVCVAVTTLSPDQLILGFLLFLACVVYTRKTYIGGKPRIVPKEFKVALLFTAGVFLFLINNQTLREFDIYLYGVLFASICLADVGLVAHWEKKIDEAQDLRSIARRWPKSYGFFKYLGPIVALTALLLTWDFSIFIAFAVPGFGLCGLDYFKKYTDLEERRAFADFLLLSPWLIW